MFTKLSTKQVCKPVCVCKCTDVYTQSVFCPDDPNAVLSSGCSFLAPFFLGFFLMFLYIYLYINIYIYKKEEETRIRRNPDKKKPS